MIIVISTILSYLAAVRYRFMLYAGLTMHIAYVMYRGATAGRLPIIGLFDTLLFMSLSIVIFALALRPFLDNKNAFTSSSAASAAVFLFPSLFLSPNNNPLPPVLDTYWFEFHVVLSFFGYALFVLGGILGIIYIKDKGISAERLQYRSILIGYTFFSVAMIAGGIWAFYAWGTYWLWTPKEFWTSILWLYYSLYLHARLHSRFAGRTASILGTAGTLVMLFTYLGVGIFMKSSHSF
ncbi:MAG: cytochrome c biogenesis protein CcsA [Nitrospirota bacterium]|nr:MAG: cytochrome c biogenesis protein CcsA [Nitrospirota bacterium]